MPEITPQDGEYAGFTSYINAGGEGTRLSQRGERVTKALITIGEAPETLLEHQLRWLGSQGSSILIPAVGEHSNVLDLAKTHPGFKSNVYPIFTSSQLGTGGDLLKAIGQRPELFTDTILISNVDTVADLEVGRLLEFHRRKGGEVTIALTRNDQMLDGEEVPNKDAFYVSSDGHVLYSSEASHNPITEEVASQHAAFRGSSIGLIAAEKDFLESIQWVPEKGPLSIYSDIAAEAITRGKMYAFDNGQRTFLDIGTPAAKHYAEQHPELFKAAE